ncbi:MAG: hypothetical protein RIB84_14730 [Sneathiellaceae bacterium]
MVHDQQSECGREILAGRQNRGRSSGRSGSWLHAGRAPLATLLFAAVLLAACNPLPYAKAVTDDMDKGFSVVTEEECDLQNVFRWESYCKNRMVVRDTPPIYCYRTLGVPNCYAVKDPYAVARRGRGIAPPMALGDAVPAAVDIGGDMSVQYAGGEAFPGYQEEVVEVASDRPVTGLDAPVPPAMPQIPVQSQTLPPKSTLRVPPEPVIEN